MGLMFPEDLAAWRRWQRGRHPARRARDLLRGPAPASGLVLHRREADPAVLFALDATTPTALASVLEPLAHLCDAPAAVLAPADVSAQLPGEWRIETVDPAAPPASLRSVRVVVSAGHFLPVGRTAFAWAQELGARSVVVQHGLLTPFMPPLPAGAHLLAFSDPDAEFWRSGRTDVTSESVGSQLLWRAAGSADAAALGEPSSAHALGEWTPSSHDRDAHSASAHALDADGGAGAYAGADAARDEAARDDAPIFLGQLHGAELPRRISAATATAFCREHGALYRPHPAETDRVSRAQHALWGRRGIRFAEPGPLSATAAPVVSIFSTGVLEAAASGRDAWVTCVRPPDWVREFWDRYGLAEWGGPATAAPEQPAVEPARAIAGAVLALAEGGR